MPSNGLNGDSLFVATVWNLIEQFIVRLIKLDVLPRLMIRAEKYDFCTKCQLNWNECKKIGDFAPIL